MLAYIDSGNALVVDTSLFSASLNRLNCTVFRGPRRVHPGKIHSVFIAFMADRENNVLTIFPHFGWVIPGSGQLAEAAGDCGVGEMHRMHSMPRVLGAWHMARGIMPYMHRGDYIVMGGPLDVWCMASRRTAGSVMAETRRRSVVRTGYQI